MSLRTKEVTIKIGNAENWRRWAQSVSTYAATYVQYFADIMAEQGANDNPLWWPLHTSGATQGINNPTLSFDAGTYCGDFTFAWYDERLDLLLLSQTTDEGNKLADLLLKPDDTGTYDELLLAIPLYRAQNDVMEGLIILGIEEDAIAFEAFKNLEAATLQRIIALFLK